MLNFRILLPVSETYLLEVSVHAWLKVVIKGSFRGKAKGPK